MAELRIGGTGDSGIERFQALREQALRRTHSTVPGVSTEKPIAPAAIRTNTIPDTRSPLGRLIDLRA